MELIDTHCHFDEPEFDTDRDLITDKMYQLGVKSLIFPAISAKKWPKLKQVTWLSMNLRI